MMYEIPRDRGRDDDPLGEREREKGRGPRSLKIFETRIKRRIVARCYCPWTRPASSCILLVIDRGSRGKQCRRDHERLFQTASSLPRDMHRKSSVCWWPRYRRMMAAVVVRLAKNYGEEGSPWCGVEGERWRVQSCSSINLNFNFWGSDYIYIIFISIPFLKLTRWKSNCYIMNINLEF